MTTNAPTQTYRVALSHPHGYTVTVTISAVSLAAAKDAANTMHPGHKFVSGVLDES